MESCFPPLAGLSLRNGNNNISSNNNNNNNNSSSTKSQKNRHSTGSSNGVVGNGNTITSSNQSHNNNNNNHNHHNHHHHHQHHYYIHDDGYQQQQNEFTPKIEVLQDLDLFYIRQIASSLQELDLEQKIDLEIKMREGSAKLLAACNNSKNANKTIGFSGSSTTLPHNTQILEAAKNLLTSNERMTAYMAELQRRKRDRDSLTTTKTSSSTTTATGSNSKQTKPTGKISLNEIRMPLMWRDTDYFKNKGDHRRFAVFCLAKIGTEIFDTSLLCPVDRNLTDISFNDAILFTNITPDFELKLEVYAVMMESDLTIASTPRKIKNTIHSSISRTVGKRLAANLKDELNNTKIGPKFDLIATATLTLADASDLPHTHDLTTVTYTTNNNCGGGVIMMNTGGTINGGTQNTTNCKLPLFGHFCCRLAVQPDFMTVNTCMGNLCLLNGNSGSATKRSSNNNNSDGTVAVAATTKIIEGYGKLQAFHLDIWDDEKLWNSMDNNTTSSPPSTPSVPPKRSMEITRDTKLKHKDEFNVIIGNMEEGTIKEYTLRTKSLIESTKWYTALKKAIREHSQWEHITLGPCMQLVTPGNKSYQLRSSRLGSLYDQVPITDATDVRQSTTTTTTTSTTARPTVHDIFSIQNSDDINNTSPKLNDFRSRTNSSGRSSSQSSSTLSASSIGSINSRKNLHWPFGGGGSSSNDNSSGK